MTGIDLLKEASFVFMIDTKQMESEAIFFGVGEHQ